MIKTYSQMHRTDKYSQHSSFIWNKNRPLWLNGWVIVYEISGCGFEPSCSHFCFSFAKKWQRKKKCLVVSVSAPQSHMGLPHSLKLWRNLCELSWLNCSRSLVSNLTPTGSCIENNDLWFKEKKFFSIDLNCLIDSASRIVLTNLFHSLIQKG